MAFDDQVGKEDRVLVEGVHRGIASGGLEHGWLMGRSEQLIGHFQQLTREALSVPR
jgi:choline monooxygenase